jgi:hypothetical protein
MGCGSRLSPIIILPLAFLLLGTSRMRSQKLFAFHFLVIISLAWNDDSLKLIWSWNWLNSKTWLCFSHIINIVVRYLLLVLVSSLFVFISFSKNYEIDYTQTRRISKVNNMSNTNTHLTLNSLEDSYIIVISIYYQSYTCPRLVFFPSMDCFWHS